MTIDAKIDMSSILTPIFEINEMVVIGISFTKVRVGIFKLFDYEIGKEMYFILFRFIFNSNFKNKVLDIEFNRNKIPARMGKYCMRLFDMIINSKKFKEAIENA